LIFDRSKAYISQFDIAKELGCTQGYVSQLLTKEIDARDMHLDGTVQEYRTPEVLRLDALVAHWHPKAMTDIKVFDSIMTALTRRDRLLGLYIERHAVSLDATNGKSVEPPINWANLSEEELRQFEFLNLKLHGIAPEPDAPQAPVIGPYHMLDASTALIEQQANDDSIVAETDPPPESLRDKILHLHTEGMSASTIAETLGITRSALLAAIEDPTIPGALIQ
jgi:predicted transcriptional regulator